MTELQTRKAAIIDKAIAAFEAAGVLKEVVKERAGQFADVALACFYDSVTAEVKASEVEVYVLGSWWDRSLLIRNKCPDAVIYRIKPHNDLRA